MINPIEWFAWIHGKFFTGHPLAGYILAILIGAIVGFMMWARGVDRYNEQRSAKDSGLAVNTTTPATDLFRPRLMVKAIRPMREHDKGYGFGAGLRPGFDVVFENIGFVPAINVVTNVTYWQSSQPLPKDQLLPLVRSNDRTFAAISVGQREIHQWTRQDHLTPQETAAMNATTNPMKVYVFGFARYSDESGKAYPPYEYCWVFNPDTSRANSDPENWPFERCDHHNGERQTPLPAALTHH